MIFTSYFGNLKKIPDTIEPISICRKPPTWYTGAQYLELAPSEEILYEYKKFPDIEKYTQAYTKYVLDRLEPPTTVVKKLCEMSNKEDICLLCYETPATFCHRHLVAKWFRKNGIDCFEWVIPLIPFEMQKDPNTVVDYKIIRDYKLQGSDYKVVLVEFYTTDDTNKYFCFTIDLEMIYERGMVRLVSNYANISDGKSVPKLQMLSAYDKKYLITTLASKLKEEPIIWTK